MKRTLIKRCPAPADTEPHTEEQGQIVRARRQGSFPVECVSYKEQGSHTYETMIIWLLKQDFTNRCANMCGEM